MPWFIFFTKSKSNTATMALVCADCGDPMVVPGQPCQACVHMYDDVARAVRQDTRTLNDQFKTLGNQSRDMWEAWFLTVDDHPGSGA